MIEGDAELVARLMPEGYAAKPEQVMVFTITAWDANCPQHIPVRWDDAKVNEALATRDQKIQALEVEVLRLTKATGL